MPSKPVRPCKKPGCSALVSSGYCEKHTPKRQQYKRINDDTFYHTQAWKKLRALKISKDPLCELCLNDGRITPGEIVHHIVEVAEDMSQALVLENLQTVCRSCHMQLHGPSGFISSELKVIVIGGPPGAGKTTYVREHMRPGDAVIDMDILWQAVSLQPHHDKPSALYRIVDKMYKTAIENIGLITTGRCYVVINGATKAERQKYRKIPGATVTLMLTRPDECIKRIQADDTRSNKAAWEQLVYKWYSKYEPD